MTEGREAIPGVYVDLAELARLQVAGRGLTFLPRQPVHSLLSGRHGSRLRGRGLTFEELRGYRPGDDIRSMDWRATARTRRPHVRVYSEERERPVYILLDQRQSMFFGSRRNMKSFTAAKVAALAAWRVQSQGDRIGALIFNERAQTFVRPRRSPGNVERILGLIRDYNHALPLSGEAVAVDDPEGQSLNRALRDLSHEVTHDALVVVISDLHDSGPTTQRRVTEIRRHNDVLLCVIEDPMEHQLPVGDDLIISDGQDQIPVDTTIPATREAFREARRSWHDTIERVGLKYDVPMLVLNTAEPVLEQVGRAFGRFQPRQR